VRISAAIFNSAAALARFGRGGAVAAALVLAGCASHHAEDGATPVAAAEVTAGFEPGGLANVIVVTAIDRQALRQAELIGPDGERQQAYSIDVTPPSASPRYVGGDQFTLTPGFLQPRQQLDLAVSRALIALPDPPSYAKTWHDWRIELRFGDANALHAQSLAAPAPPGP